MNINKCACCQERLRVPEMVVRISYSDEHQELELCKQCVTACRMIWDRSGQRLTPKSRLTVLYGLFVGALKRATTE